MRNLKYFLMVGGAAALFAACGGDSGAECGAGTVEVDGTCVPNDQACGDGTAFNTTTGLCDAVCATGTVLTGGECVPDGSVICETGTTYNSTSGKCDADITGCAAGTVLVSGECVPYDDTLVGDVTEGAEPNGDEWGATPTLVTMPAVGSDVVIEGCVETRPDHDLDDNGDGDLDFYVLQATGPTLLDLTIDGVGGMSGGYAVIPADAALSADGWFRLAVNLLGDTTQHQVFLPKAGVYILAIADSRTLTAGLAYGDGTSTCYFATLANVALPSPTAISGTTVSGSMDSDVKFYSYDPGEGDTLNTTLTIDTFSSKTYASVTTLVDNIYVSSVETASPAEDTIAGLADASAVLVAIEESYGVQQTMSYGFTFDIATLAADGSVPSDGTVSVAPGTDPSRFYFDAAANDVVRIELDGASTGTTFDVTLEGPGLGGETSLFVTTDTGDQWVSLPSGGRYYLNVVNTNGAAAGAVTPTFTRTHQQSVAYTYGTPVTDVALANGGNAFYRVDLSTAFWMSVGFTSSGFGGTPSIVGYEGNGPLTDGFPLADGLEFIIGGDTNGPGNVLIHVSDDNFGAAATPLFTIDIGPATFTDKMTPTEATPVADAAIAVAADTALPYGVNVGEDAEITITITGTGGTDAVLYLLDENGGPALVVDDNTGANTAETFTFTNDRLGSTFLPFAITTAGGTAGTLDLSITVVDPPYKKSASKVDLTDVCDNGTLVTLTDGLSAVTDIGFNMPFFGVDRTQMVISEEGWIVLDGTYADTSSIDDATDGSNPVIAPNSWGLNDDTQVCIRKTATAVSVQFRGNPFGLTANMQVVLRSSGRIDVRYGSEEDFVQFLDENFGPNSYPLILMDGTGVESVYRGLRDSNDQIKFEP